MRARLLLLVGVGLLGLGAAVIPSALATSQPVTLQGIMFHPPSQTIQVGDTVTFTRDTTADPGIPHNVHFLEDGTKLSAAADNTPSTGSFSKTKTFTQPGTYHFFCDIHGSASGTGMSGTIVVAGAGGTTQPTQPTTNTTPTTPPSQTNPTSTPQKKHRKKKHRRHRRHRKHHRRGHGG